MCSILPVDQREINCASTTPGPATENSLVQPQEWLFGVTQGLFAGNGPCLGPWLAIWPASVSPLTLTSLPHACVA